MLGTDEIRSLCIESADAARVGDKGGGRSEDSGGTGLILKVLGYNENKTYVNKVRE
jgi:hypothetical protein